jgi:putative transposase
LRYIHANPKEAGVRKGFYDPYSNYGHKGRLKVDGISERHPSFLQLASTLKECSKRYERFCQKYLHYAKGTAPRRHSGSRMLKRLMEKGTSKSMRNINRAIATTLGFDYHLNQIPEDWRQIAVRFRLANGIRDGDKERSIWQMSCGNKCRLRCAI